MKVLEVYRLNTKDPYPDLDEISAGLGRLPGRNRIETLNWVEYQYKPEVLFSVAHNGNEIFLRYYVRENFFKAEMTKTNQKVYEDSCVEFFVSPGNDGIYYNFEFNATGTCLAGSGTSRHDRKFVDPDLISRIRRAGSAGTSPSGEKTGIFEWDLTIAIPVTLFFHHTICSLDGKTFRVNFYKCGDKLTVPHYLTWNPVNTAKPDFHQPDDFGVLKFN